MLIKTADDRQPDLAALSELLLQDGLTAPIRKLVDQEIRQIQAGIVGEREAAYEIDSTMPAIPTSR
jgi:hypothetical protein